MFQTHNNQVIYSTGVTQLSTVSHHTLVLVTRASRVDTKPLISVLGNYCSANVANRATLPQNRDVDWLS